MGDTEPNDLWGLAFPWAFIRHIAGGKRRRGRTNATRNQGRLRQDRKRRTRKNKMAKASRRTNRRAA